MKKLLKMKLGFDGDPVRLWQLVKPGNDLVTIQSNEWIDFVGEYPDYPRTHLQILELIAQEIHLQFPDRLDKRISILDASSRTGICPNHTTHNGLPPLSLDIHYFTLGWPNNRTQTGENWCNIWTDGELNDHFDRERNCLLVKLLYEIFPEIASGFGCKCLAATKVKEALVSQAQIFWPPEKRILPFPSAAAKEWQDVDRAIQADDVPAYNHDKHTHTYVGKLINFEAVI